VYHILKSQIRQVDVPDDPLRILARGRMPEIKTMRDRGVLYFIHSCYIGVIGREQYTLSQVGLAMPHAVGKLLLPGILRRFSLLVVTILAFKSQDGTVIVDGQMIVWVPVGKRNTSDPSARNRTIIRLPSDLN